jgi:opacity protein-like surface antigen
MRTTNNRSKNVVLLIVALTALPVAASAQEARPPTVRPPAAWTVMPYVGVSRHSPVGHRWGLTPNRHHVLVGVHVTVPIVRGGRWTLAFAPEAIPLIIVSNNPTYHSVRNPGTGDVETVEDGRANVSGLGIAPIGLELRANASRRIGVYAATSMGGLWFTRHIPVVDARSFNFTFDFGGGVRLRMNDRMWLRAGYKFHHLSNAKTAPSNPGVDAKVFLVGLERSFGGSL